MVFNDITTLEWLVVLASCAFGLFSITVAARQIVQAAEPLRVFNRDLPASVWVLAAASAAFASAMILTTGGVLPFEMRGLPGLARAALIIVVAATGVASLVIGARQVRVLGPTIGDTERLRRSLLTGVAATGLAVSPVVIMGLLDPAYAWSLENIATVVCLVLPIAVIASIGMYFRLGLVARLRREAASFVEKSHEKQ